MPAGAVIVDVGGGVGTTQLCLAREFPDFQIIIQDRSQVIEDGIKVTNLERDSEISLTKIDVARKELRRITSWEGYVRR